MSAELKTLPNAWDADAGSFTRAELCQSRFGPTALSLQPEPKQPAISVLVPCYNSARYICERLHSIMQQNWPITQVVIMDDASTDQTVAEIGRLAVSWGLDLPVIANEVNSGSPCNQWHSAMSQLTGDLVWIAEADDVAHPDLLATLVPAFDDPRVAIAFANTLIIDENGVVLCGDTRGWLGGRDPNIWDSAFTMEGHVFLADLLAMRNVIINASGVLFRRSILSSALHHLANSLHHFRTAGDWLVYGECLRYGDVAFSPRTLNACRRQSDSVSFNLEPMAHFCETLKVQAYLLRAIQASDGVVNLAKSAAMQLVDHLNIDRTVALAAVQKVLGDGSIPPDPFRASDDPVVTSCK